MMTKNVYDVGIEWTNKAISKVKYDGPKDNAPRQTYYKFPKLTGNLKGCRLRFTPKTNKKVIEWNYTYRGKRKSLDLIDFNLELDRGIRLAEITLSNILALHQDKKGNWKSNPKVKPSVALKVGQVIEQIVEASYPRKKIKGNISKNSQSDFTRVLLGYNQRTQHLQFTEDNKGWGHTKLKSKYKTFQDLFKAYPSGKGIINGTKLNPNNETSVYDSWLADIDIVDLEPYDIETYIEEKTDRTYGTKVNILKALKCMWGFARKRRLLGKKPPMDPTRSEYGGVSITKDEGNNYKGAYLNEKSYDLEEDKKLDKAFIQIAKRHPFISEAFMFLRATGLRIEESLKIKKEYITKDKEGDPIIVIPRFVMKGKSTYLQKDEIVDITPPVQRVLNRLNRQLKRRRYRAYNFVPWLFPTTRISKEKMATPEVNPGYTQSHSTRLKPRGLNDCWKKVRAMSGVEGSIKSLRKTYATNSVDLLGLENASKTTKHKNQNTLATFYFKQPRSKVKQLVYAVANGILKD